MMATVYLGLGSNLGDRCINIAEAIDRIGSIVSSKITAKSPVYLTEPMEVEGHPVYLNNTVRMETELSPKQLYQECLRIEHGMGRSSKGDFKPRLIDIDILLYDNRTINEPELTIPHARMKQRAFVLKPLTDINPGLHCPLTDENYLEILETRLKDQKIEIFKKIDE